MARTAVLVGVCIGADTEFEESLRELGSLAQACGIEPKAVVTQNLDAPSAAHYVGTGKLPEIAAAVRGTGADLAIFNDELSPSQLRNLEKELGCEVKDRTMVILDIFASRARTREACLQVEVARLQYMLPRLTGLKTGLSQQQGGAGTFNRGAGEKLLELNRREIQTRIARMETELRQLVGRRRTQRRLRAKNGVPVVALAGYTNAGKSTLMNALLRAYGEPADKQVLEKDMLFATLETSVRRIVLPDRKVFLLTDTVGFIRRLPHHLVKAFRSTLEEVGEADLLLHVVDASSPEYRSQIEVTADTLAQIGAADIPVIYAFNKCDRTDIRPQPVAGECVYLSAKTGNGLDTLVEAVCRHIFGDYVRCEMRVPYTEGETVAYLTEHAHVIATAYEPEGTRLTLECRRADFERLRRFVLPAE